MKKQTPTLLLHPIFLFALFVLIVNDSILKWQYHNWLTGKLSDAAGLIVAPIFLFILFPKIKQHAVFALGLFFIFWKSPFSQSLIDFTNELTAFNFHRVVDYSDLITLPFLYVPYFLIRKNSKCVPFIFFKKFNPSLLILVLTSFTLFSTSMIRYAFPEGDIYLGKSFNVKKSKDYIFNKFEQKGYTIKDTIISDSISRYNSYFFIENFALRGDTLSNVKFTLTEESKRKTQIYIINITFNKEYDKQSWREMRRESRYFKRMIKLEFKDIISDK